MKFLYYKNLAEKTEERIGQTKRSLKFELFQLFQLENSADIAVSYGATAPDSRGGVRVVSDLKGGFKAFVIQDVLVRLVVFTDPENAEQMERYDFTELAKFKLWTYRRLMTAYHKKNKGKFPQAIEFLETLEGVIEELENEIGVKNG